MSEDASNDDLDPTAFVKRIRELSERHEREDAERLSSIEADIEKGRSERAARRAERARSLSPDKTLSPNLPSPKPLDTSTKAAMEALSPSIGRASALDATLDRLSGAAEPARPESPPKSASSLARSGTLSWQQRPQSGSMRRPLSVASRASVASDKPSDEKAEPTRNQIAQALGSKDPSWFKQTADRGVGNAAFRRTQEEPETDGARKFGLPGMSRPEPTSSHDSPARGATSPPPESLRSTSPSRGSTTWSSRMSTATLDSTYSTVTEPKAPQTVLDPPKLSPSANESAALGRPASPTRGAGGFVQSAMMKRSDSVNKRWSAQAGSAGLQRQNSTASVRSGISASSSMPRLDHASSLSRESSAEPSSRPGSSYSNHTVTQGQPKTDDGFVRPALPSHARSKSTMSLTSVYDVNEETDRPASPSKRWSPTKSSWLESAINRPESPRSASPTKSQPSWMAELSRSKQQKESGKVPASPSLENTTSLPQAKSSVPESTSDASVSPEAARSVLSKQPSEESVQKPDPLKSLEAVKSEALPLTTKSKPETPPKKDFRANLKAREPPKDSPSKAEPEFRNALGNLRKAETKNYVAPDTFTNNIKAGKAALNLTGGVPQRVRRDSFKETLMAQKEAIKAKKEAEPNLPPSGVAVPPRKSDDMPEFLAARQRMGSKPPVVEKSKAATDAARSPSGSKASPIVKPSFDGTHNRVSSGLRESGLAKANEGPQPASSTPTHSRSPSKASLAGSPGGAVTGLRAGVSTKLAERFNPGLANMLARGPPPVSGTKSSASNSVENLSEPTSLSRVQSDEAKESGALEHKTKGRARGPKRRAPAAKAPEPEGRQQPQPSPSAAPKPTPHFRKVSLVKPELVLGSNSPIADLAEDEQIEEPTKPTPPPKKRVLSPRSEHLPDASALGGFEFGFGATEAGASSSISADSAVESLGTTDSTPRKPYASLGRGGTSSFAEQIASKVGGASLPASTTSAAARSSAAPPSAITEFSKAQPSQSKSSVGSVTPTMHSVGPSRVQSRPSSPEKPEQTGAPSVRNAAALWGRTADSAASSPRTGPSSPIKLPSHKDEAEAKRSAGLASGLTSPARGIGLGLEKSNSKDSSAYVPDAETSQRQVKYPMSPPASAGLGLSSPKVRAQPPIISNTPATSSPAKDGSKRPRPASIVFKPPPDAPIAQTSEASQLLSEFFDSKPVMPQSIDVDTQALIKNYPGDTAKVRTKGKQIWEMTSDGKTVSLPPNEEYTLYEGSMYAIAHSFERSTSGTASEAYLWVGNGVSQSASEDVQVFAKRFAKDHKATLEVVRQGKESAPFIQALGGILVTRRGPRSQRDSMQQFMLCGRAHSGQIAFDEVDFSLRSFCSGFPFLVFAGSKLHLWRGSGSTVEEVSCARLIAMDIGVTPDVIEVAEGKEPASFIGLFPAPEKGPKKIFPSADHWQRKANCERYRTRLFHVTTTPQQQQQQGAFQTPTLLKATSPNPSSDAGLNVKVLEIAPYAQTDMEGKDGVFVLDAFFEVYIILTAQSRSSPDAFTAALLFAQDYGMMATSLEDRPLLPVSTVVVEGAPRDMKSCFRKWEDSRWASASGAGTVTLATSGAADVKRGKSLRVVGLDAAIAAAMSR